MVTKPKAAAAPYTWDKDLHRVLSVLVGAPHTIAADAGVRGELAEIIDRHDPEPAEADAGQ